MLAATIAQGQVDETGLKPAEWGKVDRKAAISTALRVLDLNAEYSGDASAAVALRNGGGKFTVGRRKGEVAAIYLKIGEWDFRFTPRTGGLLSAKRPQDGLHPVEQPLPAARLENTALRFLSAAGITADSFEPRLYESERTSGSPVVDMVVRAYHGGLCAYQSPYVQLSAADSSLIWLNIRTDMDFDTLSREKRLPKETCLRAAIDAYQRFRPFRNTAFGKFDAVIGSPPRNAEDPHEISPSQRQTMRSQIGIPMYQFTFLDADYCIDGVPPEGVFVRRQYVSVDMLTGTAMTIWDPGEPLGGKAAKLSPFNKGLDKLGSLSVVGRQGEGRAKALPTTRTDEPAGAKVFVRSGKLVIAANLDVKGLLWTFDGKLWHAFKPDAAFAKAAKAAAAAKPKPWGSVEASS